MSTRESLFIALRAVLSVFVCGFFVWYANATWVRAYEGYSIEKTWHPPAQRYSARVVGFTIGSAYQRQKTPTVRITFADGKTADFNSSRSGTYSEGDDVRVLESSYESRLVIQNTVLSKRVSRIYEIDDPYLLWTKDACYGLFFAAFAIGSLLVGFAPFLALARSRTPLGDGLQAPADPP
jgi:hypothetical protein